jgi:hypothetical protein
VTDPDDDPGVYVPNLTPPTVTELNAGVFSDSGLTRITFHATPIAKAAVDSIMAQRGTNRTDAINRALAIAALVERLSDDLGSLRIVAEDGTTERIYLL